jgi:hypothetical protein
VATCNLCIGKLFGFFLQGENEIVQGPRQKEQDKEKEKNAQE